MVEPVSGKIYELDADSLPFVAVESVWNDRNYWVNVQGQEGVEAMSWDLDDATKWEFVLFPDGQRAVSERRESQSEGNEAAKERVHLPAPWMAPFFLSQKQMDCPLPREAVTRHFSKCSLTQCNRFHSKRGLILKLTLFRDDSKLIIDEIRERFQDRSDLLILRITKLQSATNVIYERFAIGSGPSSGIKDLITIGQQRRITTFYADSRTDGMLRRLEVFGTSLTEHFVDRADGVEKRTLILQPVTASDHPVGGDLDAKKLKDGDDDIDVDEQRDGDDHDDDGGHGDDHDVDGNAMTTNIAMKEEAVRFRLCLGGDPNLECSVLRIEQQYSKRSGDGDVDGERPSISSSESRSITKRDSVRMLSIDVVHSEYAVNYHYGANRILSAKCSFNKETGSVIGWNPNPLSTNPDAAALKQQFEDLIVAEKNLLTEIRERERAFGVLLSKIEDEREPNNLSLIEDVYFGAKCKSKEITNDDAVTSKQPKLRDSGMEHHQNAMEQHHRENDRYSMLHSFLPKSLKSGGDSNQNLSREQIEQIKEDCLRSLKERLVQRLNIITKRLHSEIQSLEKEKANFENWQNRDVDSADALDRDEEMDEMTVADRELLGHHKESAFRAKQKESECRINIIKQRLAKHEQAAIHKMNQLSDLLDSYPPLQ